MNSPARLTFISLLANRQVFVIENDSESRTIYSYLLQDYGAKVKLFSSHQEAAKTLDWLSPDIVICEMSFLDKNAQALKRKLKDLELKTGKQTSVIFPTGSYVTDAAGVGRFTDSMHVKLLQAVGCDYARAQRIVNS
jgi:response regulator RpfG family c-di-GMP phosphodiesterase